MQDNTKSVTQQVYTLVNWHSQRAENILHSTIMPVIICYADDVLATAE